jgi:outer membrane protein TolC
MFTYRQAKRVAATLAVLSMGCLCASAQHAPATQTLSLPEVLEMALANNQTILAGREQVEYARQVRRQARSALLPQLSGQLSQGRARTLADRGTGSLEPDMANNLSASLVLSMKVIDATNIANYKAAGLEASAANYQQMSDQQDVCADAASLYFLLQRHISSLRVIEDSIALDRVLLDISQKRRQADVATELDLTRAKAALARDLQSQLAQQTLIDQTRLQLLQTIGMDLSAAPQPIDDAVPAPDLSSLPGWESVLQARPEFLAANELLERNRVAERAAQWQRFPSVAVQGEYGHSSWLPGDGEGGGYWSIGLAMSVPIYEGGMIDAQKMQARALIRQQEHRIRQISDNVRAAYDLAVSALRKRWEEIPLAEEAVKLGELEVRFARERFEAGVADNSDVVSAQVTLSQAADGLVDAIYRYQLARTDLARVLGDVQGGLVR